MRLEQVFSGASLYYPDYHQGPHRMLLAVTCRFAGVAHPVPSLLDTGSEWCVLPRELAEQAGYDLIPDPHTPRLSTRFGSLAGRLERLPLTLTANQGTDLVIEATCFITEDWHGPPVIGWKGCLERLRFAIDPGTDTFYFAAL